RTVVLLRHHPPPPYISTLSLHDALPIFTADKLAANSVTTGSIQAGAIRGTHIAAGELTADKLAIGLGGNLLYNPIFANNADGWRSEEHTSELQSRFDLVCRLLLEKKNKR